MHAQRFASSDRERCRRDLALAAQGMDLARVRLPDKGEINQHATAARLRYEAADRTLATAIERYLKSF